MRRNSLFFSIIVCFAFSGCASIEDWHFRNVNHIRSQLAWRDAKCRIPENRINSDFARGWKNGYFDVSTGASNSLPAVPPHRYWSSHYQDMEGRCKIENFYSGWRCGANEANMQNRPLLNTIPAKVCDEDIVQPVGSYMPNDMNQQTVNTSMESIEHR